MTTPPGEGWSVAFFRNLNLGQPRSKSPRSAELVAAFAAVGAEPVVNFQTNGTVLFGHPGPAAAARGARDGLTALTGYADEVLVRPGDWLVELADRLDPLWPAAEVALFDLSEDGRALPPIAPGTLDPSGLTFQETGPGFAVTSGAHPGVNAGPVLTRMTAGPVTCRGVPTMLRLGAKLRTLGPLRPR